MIMFYVTYASETDAQAMVKKLLDERLIACGNISPISSNYIWEGKPTTEDEYISVLKTSYGNAPAVEAFIEKHHPYDVPCIARWEFQCNKSYEQWIINSIIEQ